MNHDWADDTLVERTIAAERKRCADLARNMNTLARLDDDSPLSIGERIAQVIEGTLVITVNSKGTARFGTTDIFEDGAEIVWRSNAEPVILPHGLETPAPVAEFDTVLKPGEKHRRGS